MRRRVRVGAALALILAYGMLRPATAADTLRDHILSTVPKDMHVVVYLSCPVLGSYHEVVCVVTEKEDTSSVDEPSRILQFYKVENGGPRKIFQYDSYNGLDSIEMIDKKTLLAVWMTGSAFQFTMFRSVGKAGIKQILDSGGKTYPELVDLDGDGVSEVLIPISEWVLRKGKREFVETKARIYRFGEDKYEEIGVVPWADRYRALPISERTPPPVTSAIKEEIIRGILIDLQLEFYVNPSLRGKSFEAVIKDFSPDDEQTYAIIDELNSFFVISISDKKKNPVCGTACSKVLKLNKVKKGLVALTRERALQRQFTVPLREEDLYTPSETPPR